MKVRHVIRSRSGGTVTVEFSRTKAIKAHCTECCGFGEIHPKDCLDTKCALYPFRGKSELAYGNGVVDIEEDGDD